MIDSHCHLCLKDYPISINEILNRFKNKGGTFALNISTNINEANQSFELLEIYDYIFQSIGIHPEFLIPNTPFFDQNLYQNLEQEFDKIAKLANKKLYNKTQKPLTKEVSKIDNLETTNCKTSSLKAIGETGIDLYYISKNLPKNQQEDSLNLQKKLFDLHTKLAIELNLPLVIHSRENKENILEKNRALLEIIDILKQNKYNLPIIFHSYTYTEKELQLLKNFNYFLGANGIITYENTNSIKQAFIDTNISRILLETDCPFLLPSNTPKTEILAPKLNEPQFIYYTAQIIAKIKDMNLQEVIESTDSNFKNIFNIK